MRLSPIQGLALYTCVLDSALANFQEDTPSLSNLGRWQHMRDEQSSPWAPGPSHGLKNHGFWRTYSEKAQSRSSPTARLGDRSRQVLASDLLQQQQYTDLGEDEESGENPVLNVLDLEPHANGHAAAQHGPHSYSTQNIGDDARGEKDQQEQHREEREQKDEKIEEDEERENIHNTNGAEHGEDPETVLKHQGTNRRGGQREDSFALRAVHLPREGSRGWAIDSYRRTMAMGKGLERLVKRIKGRVESVLPTEAENAVAHGRRYRDIIANLSSSLQHFETGVKHFRVNAFEHHQATSAVIRKTMAQAFKEKR